MTDLRFRLLALGASNLAHLALAAVDAARVHAGGAVEAHMALGRGRSYGIATHLLGRGLDSVRDSELWAAVAGGEAERTTALVMDVGNDLLYGVQVPQILAWVDDVLHRLQGLAARRIVIGLPLEPARQLSRWRFELIRRLLVPGCRLSLAEAIAGAEELHGGLHDLAQQHGAAFFAPHPDWYGLDPLHIRRRHWRPAVRSWLEVPAAASTPTPPIDRGLARAGFLFAAPHRRRWFGREHLHSQPTRRWRDGSTLSLW